MHPQLLSEVIKTCRHNVASDATRDVNPESLEGAVVQLADSLTQVVDQAQQMLSRWNDWYGQHGANLPLPPAGIVKTQEALAEARSLLSA